MKKRLISLLAALFAAALLHAQYRTPLDNLDDSETVHALKEHVGYLASAQLEGRKAGSEGERMAAEYLSGKLAEYGIDVIELYGCAVFAEVFAYLYTVGTIQF